jgi:uncharacterized repeat protein (TIGR01451 family)
MPSDFREAVLVEGDITGSGVFNENYSTVIDGGNNLDGNPLFIDPQPASNAPTTDGDYRLGADSPAIDAGNNDADINAFEPGVQPLPATDLGGYGRIVNGMVDLGAYEAGPELHITKTVDQTNPAPGDTIRYTLTISNGGELTTSTALISDTLPTGLTFVPGSLEIDGTPQNDPTDATLADGVSVLTTTDTVITFDAEVENVAAGTVITNTASVQTDEDATLVSSSVAITVAAAPGIAVSVTPDVSSAEVGDTITYTYRITNTGNITLTAVSAVDDMLGTIDVSNTLAMGEWAEATAVYTPTEDDLPGPITNTVAVTGTWSYDSDTGEVSDEASATVNVTPFNQAPVAEDDIASTVQGAPVAIAVLDNDSDSDGDPLAVVAVGTPTDGTAAISGTSTIVYTPTAVFAGTSPFTYTISDGALTDSAAVTVTVTSDSEPPAAPVVTSPALTDSPYPTISGTAEAGVTITLTIDLGGGASVTYTTTADGDGTWSIDLANDTPTDGELPDGGLSDGSYPVTVTATNDTGSASTSHTLTVQTSTPAAGTTLYLPLIAR